MTDDFYIFRIISGCIRLKIRNNSTVFLFRKPSVYQRYMAEELYNDLVDEYKTQGLFSQEELNDYMIDNNLWSFEEDDKITQLKKNLEEIKIGIYKAAFRSIEKNTLKKASNTTKLEMIRLLEKKNSYAAMSANGAAELGKNRYLFGCSLFYEDNSPVFKTIDFWKEDSQLVNRLIASHDNQKISDEKYRELARNETWRFYWGARKISKSVFCESSLDLTDEQRYLAGWTLLYDGVFECPDCPPDEIINDDDALDGWLTLQKREREGAKNQKMLESTSGSDNLKKYDEVFLPVNTLEDARKIEQLNSESSRNIKRQRDRVIKQKGKLDHDKLPDVKQEIMMQANREMFERGKNGK